MKRNNLTTAIVAGLTGIAGIASVSNAAVSLNTDGIGQVLVFPYYTVNNNLSTLITVVNTTDQTKAVKVRFLEGKATKEVLDFNLYLSPFDVWTANLSATTATSSALGVIGAGFSGYVGNDSAVLTTDDASCTVPQQISGQEFKPYAFDGDATAINNLSRATEGHFEMIEMGVVTGAYADAILHNDAGVPANCDLINGLWYDDANVANVWQTGSPQGSDLVLDDLDGTGGLFGDAYIIDVTNGYAVSYNADAIQGFKTSRNHTAPGDLTPSIVSADSLNGLTWNSAVVKGTGVEITSWGNPQDAISALYMHDNLYNEFVISSVIAGATEWVITFPTKKFYVDPDFTTPPRAPFTTTLGTAGACEAFSPRIYDREEGPNVPPPMGCPVGTILYVDPNVADDQGTCISPPSPTPPPGTIVNPTAPTLCWETNVLEFTDTPNSDPSGILGSTSKRAYFVPVVTPETATKDLDTDLSAGWVRLGFSTQSNTSGVDAAGGYPVTYTGLPVTGFSVQRFTNVAEGKLYGSIFKHRASRNIFS